MEELGQLSNICICIPSRISPPGFDLLNISTLSKGAAINTFHQVYKRYDQANSILEQLDFHALSVTLLATVAQSGALIG